MNLTALVNESLNVQDKITLVAFSTQEQMVYFVSTYKPQQGVVFKDSYLDYKNANGSRVILRRVADKEDVHRCAGYCLHSLVLIGGISYENKMRLLCRVRGDKLELSAYEGTVDKLTVYN
jgi:hypothetical protein